MPERITLRDALTAWSQQSTHGEGSNQHIPPAELYELLVEPPDNETRARLFHHLTRCPRCLQELQEMAESLEEAERLEEARRQTPPRPQEDWQRAAVALPRAAAAELQGPKRIPTEDGKYTIIIRPHTVNKQRGVITVEVAVPYRESLEGKIVTLTEGRGQILVQGKIVNGAVSQVVQNLEEIIQRFLIEVE